MKNYVCVYAKEWMGKKGMKKQKQDTKAQVNHKLQQIDLSDVYRIVKFKTIGSGGQRKGLIRFGTAEKWIISSVWKHCEGWCKIITMKK